MASFTIYCTLNDAWYNYQSECCGPLFSLAVISVLKGASLPIHTDANQEKACSGSLTNWLLKIQTSL